ncbi:uncharacterized protein CIMG_11291 [Coccidioides immitis RS]|uniref:Uncharacterized protein n=2 Tax=Coccidioides immitis TaxID=5501 RepID=A0A0D8JUC6_COCIM|nr:uncharacterized protein CIMG_11291 [Coccidioides immitis RS]KJF60950.1 hypothetical protein CIMG_11291 [Coccidioides immitis RS]KMP04422.1 hypothetical protein CIRG_04104 [Coccidioides immitis RMSCC 2394]
MTYYKYIIINTNNLKLILDISAIIRLNYFSLINFPKLVLKEQKEKKKKKKKKKKKDKENNNNNNNNNNELVIYTVSQKIYKATNHMQKLQESQNVNSIDDEK